MGQKPKTLTDEQAVQLEALAAYLSQDQIADYFGITRVTLKAMMEREPTLAMRYKRGKATAIAKVANSLVQDAINGDRASKMFFLKTQGGWRETVHVDNSSSDGSMATNSQYDWANVPTELLRELKAHLEPKEEKEKRLN